MGKTVLEPSIVTVPARAAPCDPGAAFPGAALPAVELHAPLANAATIASMARRQEFEILTRFFLLQVVAGATRRTIPLVRPSSHSPPDMNGRFANG